MAGNTNLHKAKDAKNDEWYTRIQDVSEELRHYKHHFKDQIVFCNCDDPTWSAFWKYFHLNFAELGLKKLISTHYDANESTYKMEYMGGNDNDVEVGIKTPLLGNGDFRNQECLKILKESMLVVTNPPYSLFREYLGTLMKYEKKFIIVGNPNAITYKEVFPLIRNNDIWLGYRKSSGGGWFTTPKSFEDAVRNGKKATWKEVDGVFLVNCPMIWFTNLDIAKRHEKLILWKNYTPEEYPKYDNYDAINVDKVSEIPCDYDGVMGVPITFLDKYNPDQFEIIELGNSRDNFTPNKDYINPKKHLKDGKTVNGGAINCVLAIEYPTIPHGIYYTSDNSKYLVPPYARILIKKKEEF